VQETIRAAEKRLGAKGRIVVRKSGTEPLVRIMAEGDDEALVQDVVGEIANAVRDAERAA
jgi:phosphoglucosamine mutase